MASNTTSDITASSVPAAYAPLTAWDPICESRWYTSSGSVSVEPATFEETTSTAPISPSARAVVNTTP